MAITADSLLLGIKDRGIIPSNRAQLTDARFLAMADRVIESRLVPLLLSVDEEFCVVYTTQALVASQSIYPTPYRSINRGLREIKAIDSSGNVSNMAKVSLEDEHLFTAYTDLYGFYFIGDSIHTVPDVPATLGTTVTLGIWYPCQPSSLVAISGAALVTGVSATTVTVSAIPSTITTGTVVDFVQGKSGASIYATDKTVAAAAGTTLTFAAGVIPQTAPYALAAGDYVSVAGTSPVVNFVPNVAQSYLESLLCQSILESIGDEVGARALENRLYGHDGKGGEKAALLQALSPRTKGEPEVIINRQSLVRGRSNRMYQRLTSG